MTAAFSSLPAFPLGLRLKGIPYSSRIPPRKHSNTEALLCSLSGNRRCRSTSEEVVVGTASVALAGSIRLAAEEVRRTGEGCQHREQATRNPARKWRATDLLRVLGVASLGRAALVASLRWSLVVVVLRRHFEMVFRGRGRIKVTLEIRQFEDRRWKMRFESA